MIKNILSIVSIALFSTGAVANVGASSVKVKVYGVAVSENADCTNGKVLTEDQSGTVYDFAQSPRLVSGHLDPGTYNCVMLYINTNMTFTPDATAGNCSTSSPFDYDVHIDDGGSEVTFTTAQPVSGILTFTGVSQNVNTDRYSSVEDNTRHQVLFISTQSAGTGNNAFMRPDTNGSTNGLTLGSPLVVPASGSVNGTFVIDFQNTLGDDGAHCGSISAPTFTFR